MVSLSSLLSEYHVSYLNTPTRMICDTSRSQMPSPDHPKTADQRLFTCWHEQADSHACVLCGNAVGLPYGHLSVTGVPLSSPMLEKMWLKHPTENRNCLAHRGLQGSCSDEFCADRTCQHESLESDWSHSVYPQVDGGVFF